MTEPGSLRRAVRAALILARPHALAGRRAAPMSGAAAPSAGPRAGSGGTASPSAPPHDSAGGLSRGGDDPPRRSLVPRGIVRSETGPSRAVPSLTDPAPVPALRPPSPTHDSSTRPLPSWDATADALSRSAILAQAGRAPHPPLSEAPAPAPPPTGARTVASQAVGYGSATQALEPIEELDETPTGRSSALREPLEEAGGDWAPIDSLPKPGDRGSAATAALPASRGTMQLGALVGGAGQLPASDGAEAKSAPTPDRASRADAPRRPPAQGTVDEDGESEER